MVAPDPWPRPAALLGAALLAGLLALTIFAALDRSRVGELERFSETTAVGDKVFYRVPQPPPQPPAPVATLQGRSLVPISYEKFEWRDTRMRAVARDPATRLTIYQTREPREDAAFFVKLRNHEYLRLRAD